MQSEITGEAVPVTDVQVRGEKFKDEEPRVCSGCQAPQPGGTRCRYCGAEVR